MNPKMRSAMLEATRLTNAGQLAEATAAIQHALGGGSAPHGGSAARGDGPDHVRAGSGHATTRHSEAVIEGSYRVVGSNRSSASSAGGNASSGTSAGTKADSDTGTSQGTSRDTHESPFRSRRPRHSHWGREAPSAFRSRAKRRQHKPGDATAPGRFLTENFSNHAGTLTYKLYVPAAYQGQSLPLVVMLHGCTQNPDDFAAGTRMNQLAETTPCLVAYPAQSQSANMSRCWNWFKTSDQQRDQGEPAIIAGITREIAAAYAVDRDRIYVAGLSSGGSMAAIMGAAYPDVFAAVAVHSGPDHANAHDLPSAFAAMHGGGAMPGLQPGEAHRKTERAKPFVPNIMFHGDQDYTVRPRSRDEVSEHWDSTPRQGHGPQAADAGLDASQQRGQVPRGHAYTRSVYRDPAGRAVAEHWLIHGAGHAWSGGSASGSYTDARGPDATAEMMRFFGEHRLSDWRITGR